MTNENPNPLRLLIPDFPLDAPVLDMTAGPLEDVPVFSIGRYHEKRPGTYRTDLFQAKNGKPARDIHMGIDFFAPVGTPLKTIHPGRVWLQNYNASPGDYGHVIITEHVILGKTVYLLWGHLAKKSLGRFHQGQEFKAGETIGWVGDVHENGGWPHPHLHLQASIIRPDVCDMPGVVSEVDLPQALVHYPDPRMLLGTLY